MDSFIVAKNLRLSKRDMSILLVLRELPFLPVDFIRVIFGFSSHNVYPKMKTLRENGLIKQLDLVLNSCPMSVYHLDKKGMEIAERIALNPLVYFKKSSDFSWREYAPCRDFSLNRFRMSWIRTNPHFSTTHLLELWARLRNSGAFSHLVLPLMVEGNFSNFLYGPVDIVGYMGIRNGKLRGWVSFLWEFNKKSSERVWERLESCFKNPSCDWHIVLAPRMDILKNYAKVLRLSYDDKYKDYEGSRKEFSTIGWKSTSLEKIYFGLWVPSGLQRSDDSRVPDVPLYRWDHEIFDGKRWDTLGGGWLYSKAPRLSGVREMKLGAILGAYALATSQDFESSEG